MTHLFKDYHVHTAIACTGGFTEFIQADGDEIKSWLNIKQHKSAMMFCVKIRQKASMLQPHCLKSSVSSNVSNCEEASTFIKVLFLRKHIYLF